MITIDTVLIKIASRCNIDCSYCYVYNMGDTSWTRLPKLMSDDTRNATAQALGKLYRDQRSGFAVVLHGGEPLLVGTTRLTHILSSLRASLGSDCSLNIQTNGILISDTILDICAEHSCSISISLDGPEYVHDRQRKGHTGQPTHAQVIRGINKLRDHKYSNQLFSGLLAVIDPQSNPSDVYLHLKAYHPPSIDFLYRDGNHSIMPIGKQSYLSTEYGLWLCKLFDIYVSDPKPSKIRFLDDLVKLLLGGTGRKEGVGLTNYGILIVDTDGTLTKNDTLKSAFDGADRFDTTWNVFQHDLSTVIATNEFARSHNLQRPTSRHCLSCEDLYACGGGMPLHRWSKERRYENPSVYCNDQRLLLTHMRKRLSSFGVAA